MPYITVGGERLFYAPVEGDLTGRRNLILVHGAGGDHTHWPAELRRMPGVNVYPLDLPGHGRSAGQGRTTVDEYADTVDLFVRALGLEHAAVAGHSMGGAIAQTLALRGPEWLTGVALIGSGARLRVHPLILEGLSAGVASRQSFEVAIQAICQLQYGPAVSLQLARKGRQQLLSVDPAVIHGDYLACNQFDVMDRVGDVHLPVLIVTGSADQMTPPQYGQDLHERISDSHLVEIKDAGHMLALEKPLEVSRAVAHFLQVISFE